MKIVSWNINGLNNILSKTKNGQKNNLYIQHNSLQLVMDEHDPDIICLQEVRCNNSQALLSKHFQEKYPYIYVNAAQRPGYSGTALLSKVKPLDVTYDFPDINKEHELNIEGRVISAMFSDFTIINVYSPNSKQKLERLDYRINVWEPTLRDLIHFQKKKNPNIIVCGDLNVAHKEIDIHNPFNNTHHAGFTERERLSFSLMLHNNDMIDTFRAVHPNMVKYSWWSNFHNARDKNKGWRIDYCLASKVMGMKIVDADILTQYHGSDHAPTVLVLS